MNVRVLFGGALALLGLVACHSANWSPPEPHQAPTPSPAAPPTEATPASMPEPESAVSASAAAPSSELPPPASAESPAAPTPSAAATDAPAAGGKPKPNSHKEAHEPEPSATADAYSGPDPCQAKTFHYSAIGGACKKGGRKAVKDIMRGVVKKAKAAGQDVQCLSCHEDTSTFHLKSNAVSDIKQWL